MHINIKRVRRRNGLRGGLAMAKNILKNIINSEDIFSKQEIANADIALTFIDVALTREPKNYITLRYNK